MLMRNHFVLLVDVRGGVEVYTSWFFFYSYSSKCVCANHACYISIHVACSMLSGRVHKTNTKHHILHTLCLSNLTVL